MLTIKCPNCSSEGKVSFIKPDYEGPYKCWKCQKIFSIKVRGGQVISCEPLSADDLQRVQEIEALKSRYSKNPPAKD
jgi:DNA-directed RNA polymerase subunit RPC12/RpoP